MNERRCAAWNMGSDNRVVHYLVEPRENDAGFGRALADPVLAKDVIDIYGAGLGRSDPAAAASGDPSWKS